MNPTKSTHSLKRVTNCYRNGKFRYKQMLLPSRARSQPQPALQGTGRELRQPISYYKLNTNKTQELPINIPRNKQTTLSKLFQFDWKEDYVVYLGVRITKSMATLLKYNHLQMLTTLRQELDKCREVLKSYCDKAQKLFTDLIWYKAINLHASCGLLRWVDIEWQQLSGDSLLSHMWTPPPLRQKSTPNNRRLERISQHEVLTFKISSAGAIRWSESYLPMAVYKTLGESGN
ncbi:Hypothetical predicted protein [Pelobates cultripes]|uniref:Uncharacterized protein n=1 Tax=Pelobates cultripes TaxID=61616 RepID=A0AAD1RZ09_PELCU|nr:Hypothetical predicted protein [Pelobates cultripes]